MPRERVSSWPSSGIQAINSRWSTIGNADTLTRKMSISSKKKVLHVCRNKQKVSMLFHRPEKLKLLSHTAISWLKKILSLHSFLSEPGRLVSFLRMWTQLCLRKKLIVVVLLLWIMKLDSAIHIVMRFIYNIHFRDYISSYVRTVLKFSCQGFLK